jgi:hypothetical protein
MSFEVGTLLVGVLVTGHVVARLRNGNVRNHYIGASQIEVTVQTDPAVVFEAIRRIDKPYRVDDADAESKRLVLSIGPTVFSWGFLHPIEIAAVEDGSKVTIGIISKFISGMIEKPRAHERCARAIKGLFAVPAMRVT